ncbi:MAG: NAD(P)-dependent oxidoreductase [Rhodospirillales bacterium]|nr:NAD(P)-dependent oxidoreductase [Rhodospirillales bacterium]MBO6788329.1 NAD(P)-dependent oxidoreductase [Rhodospirillales bacterium]
MTNVGFIGLGRMGAGMANNILSKTGSLRVFDAHEGAMRPLVEAGATACVSPAEMAQNCELIFMCLPYAPEVRSAIFGDGGIAEAKPTGLTIVDTTTLDRTDALAIASETTELGVDYWDCPISGMPFRAKDGTLTVMFGGSDAAFEMAKPYLEQVGTSIIHCGPIGTGQAMKALNNIIYNVNIAALAEVLPLTVAVGLDPEQVAQIVMSGSSRSFASEYFVPRMLEAKFDTDFTLSAAYKDIVNVERMAEETGAALPVVDAMIGSYKAAIEAGYGDEPKSAMLKVYEEALGVAFRSAAFRKSQG